MIMVCEIRYFGVFGHFDTIKIFGIFGIFQQYLWLNLTLRISGKIQLYLLLARFIDSIIWKR